MVETTVIVERLAQAIGIDKDKILLKSIKELITSALRDVFSESMEIKRRYGVESSEEMDGLYRSGKLEEEHSWRDFFRLRHLEEQVTVLEELLAETSVE